MACIFCGQRLFYAQSHSDDGHAANVETNPAASDEKLYSHLSRSFLACSLAKFIFNETAAVQGTIIRPCSGTVTHGIQANIHAAATLYVNELVCMHE